MAFWCSTLKSGGDTRQEKAQTWGRDLSERLCREMVKKQVRRSAVPGSHWHCSFRPTKWKSWRASVRMPTSGKESLPCRSAFNCQTLYPRIWLPLIWLEFNWNFRGCNHSSLHFSIPCPECHHSSCYWYDATFPPRPGFISTNYQPTGALFLFRTPKAPTPYLHSSQTAFDYLLPSCSSMWQISLPRC